MPHKLKPPLTYLITPGKTSAGATPGREEFRRVLALVEDAIGAGVSLVQLREKRLPARALYELASAAAALARGSGTLILVNDRADVARAAGCDGVHLTATSLDARDVRRAFGGDFIIGVSTHSQDEARRARASGADFAVLGPVFETPSKLPYGPPLGLEAFAESARALAPFPLVALGGVARENLSELFGAGAAGVAAIRMFAEAGDLAGLVREVRRAGCHEARDEGY
ncbi:MAG TPA: thiamine phosphate synthase [Pyrinomonadaceae bacterium]|nr:thiamine phosphate synthase [Pyrinomonadaceae bacterium]